MFVFVFASLCTFYSMMTTEANVFAQTIFKCVSVADRMCVRVCFLPNSVGFYGISAFYLWVRKDLFTFRIPVSSER